LGSGRRSLGNVFGTGTGNDPFDIDVVLNSEADLLIVPREWPIIDEAMMMAARSRALFRNGAAAQPDCQQKAN
jgi:hypothetical protein